MHISYPVASNAHRTKPHSPHVIFYLTADTTIILCNELQTFTHHVAYPNAIIFASPSAIATPDEHVPTTSVTFNLKTRLCRVMFMPTHTRSDHKQGQHCLEYRPPNLSWDAPNTHSSQWIQAARPRFKSTLACLRSLLFTANLCQSPSSRGAILVGYLQYAVWPGAYIRFDENCM